MIKLDRIPGYLIEIKNICSQFSNVVQGLFRNINSLFNIVISPIASRIIIAIFIESNCEKTVKQWVI